MSENNLAGKLSSAGSDRSLSRPKLMDPPSPPPPGPSANTDADSSRSGKFSDSSLSGPGSQTGSLTNEELRKTMDFSNLPPPVLTEETHEGANDTMISESPPSSPSHNHLTVKTPKSNGGSSGEESDVVPLLRSESLGTGEKSELKLSTSVTTNVHTTLASDTTVTMVDLSNVYKRGKNRFCLP